MNPSAADPSSRHPLDNPVWQALTGPQAPLARGEGLARRFDPAYARFAALAEESPAAFDALAGLVAPGEDVSVVLAGEPDPGPRFELLFRKPLVQMAAPRLEGEDVDADTPRFEVLGEADRAAMGELVRATEPGPWAERTAELGRFVGLKEGGRLVAMAGERLHVGAHREISAVCTDPAWRGRGLARLLMLDVGRAMLARGEQPFLHVFATNTTAIALYRRLGFVERTRLHATAVRRIA